MIVSRKIPKNKTLKNFETFDKMFEKLNTPNISKLLKIVKNNFNLSFPQKQPCSDTLLKINNMLIKK